MPALHRDDADGLRHVGGDDRDDALRGLHQPKAELLRQLADRLLREILVDRHAAAEQIARVERLQHDIGVGDGRLGIAFAVADRTGIGAGAARTHLQEPATVDIGNRAAAGTDGMNVEHRRLDRVAVHDRFGGEPRLAGLQQRDVGRGAAHVEGDEVGQTGRAADGLRADHAGGRAGQHGAHRHVGGRLEADDAAVRLSEMRRDRHAERGQARRKAIDVALHHRAEIGIHHRGREPLEFTELRRDLVARADESLGIFLLHDRLGAELMLRPHEAVQKRDRDRTDAGRAQRARRGTDRVFVERDLDVAGMTHALGDLETQVARDQRRRLVGEDVVKIGPLLPADLQQIAKPVGGDEAGRHALVLDQRVGRDRRAVAEIADRRCGLIARLRRHAAHAFFDTLRNAAGGIVGGRGHLPDLDAAFVLFEQTDVGKCPARIHAYAPTRHARCPRLD